MATVGGNIARLRKAKGLTQRQLGALVNRVDGMAVSRWERGSNMPNSENLVALVEALECPLQALYSEPEPEPEREAA